SQARHQLRAAARKLPPNIESAREEAEISPLVDGFEHAWIVAAGSVDRGACGARTLEQPAGAFGRLRIIDDVAHTQETRGGMAKLCRREYRLHSQPSTRRPFSRRTTRLIRRAKSKL